MIYVPIHKKAKILNKKNLTENTIRFVFDKTMLPDFLPGQYVDLFLDVDGKKEYHSFTISSSPLEKTFSITTKKGNSEYKKQLIGKKIGETLDFSGPLGGFVLPEKTKHSLVLLSGGLGITPFYTMITYIHKKHLPIPITLIASFAELDDIVFFDELQIISKKDKAMQIIYMLSKKPFANWIGESGRISKGIIQKYVASMKGSQFFIAGPTEMIDDIQDVLLSMGVSQDAIRVEYYPGY